MSYYCKAVRTLKGSSGPILDMVGLIHDDCTLISGHENGTISFWDLSSRETEPKRVLEGLGDDVGELAVLENQDFEGDSMVLALLKKKESLCFVSIQGMDVLATIKLGSKRGDFAFSTKTSNNLFQFLGKGRPCLAILNQSSGNKSVQIYDFKF